ncbi:hypothetical protein BDP27DRAFT_169470 [Rhodocollybia butyracea]|uniref:Uncharacterized protein n=1 Tax=Rhodocollybia butyracea TaxID=206335 RepID=A0A9P5PI49_9AGAR|nr:hypothetical protein BDP27DRAFT_169470 [Rhodocollybia butyracea]
MNCNSLSILTRQMMELQLTSQHRPTGVYSLLIYTAIIGHFNCCPISTSTSLVNRSVVIFPGCSLRYLALFIKAAVAQQLSFGPIGTGNLTQGQTVNWTISGERTSPFVVLFSDITNATVTAITTITPTPAASATTTLAPSEPFNFTVSLVIPSFNGTAVVFVSDSCVFLSTKWMMFQYRKVRSGIMQMAHPPSKP